MVRPVIPTFDILTRIDTEEILRFIEHAARTCYKSEHLTDENSHHKLVQLLVKRGHWAMIEHAPAITVRIVGDRGATHELVRHRLASFAQESTRYVDYFKKGEIRVIFPAGMTEAQMNCLYEGYRAAEKCYFDLRDMGVTPEKARSVLPIGLKAEIVITANLREWHHILDLRTANYAHPTIRGIMKGILVRFKDKIPYIFDDL